MVMIKIALNRLNHIDIDTLKAYMSDLGWEECGKYDGLNKCFFFNWNNHREPVFPEKYSYEFF